ncbi:hypothetical protein PHYSODRAFT_306907 [Phytophthora sojae]|uniref:Uncharacterized protein n=1 Tax=Phytophthora sojae (strain P6497) TaxID=1094619 RepID=G5ABK6_PHYSP|nr:hypothetical protein PHYSODRAFT_306907 [Phytophthora sojae]EGZ06731.1 hypothetical protein PHYSODRAFT_306907 [Phytophthora sojae]|eukprot:XP_009537495.1 hypothetical protein PHYSODRAFT_306907 [Phytophthora sojae]
MQVPSVGQSRDWQVFGVFLLLVFMTEKRDIAYRSLRESCPYYFNWNSSKGYEIPEMPLAGKKYEGLFDGNECGGALDYSHFHHTFLFASPCTKNYHHFEKDSCITVYMNPWSKAECQTFADQIELKDPDEWHHIFNLVGGDPQTRVLFLFRFRDLGGPRQVRLPDDDNSIEELAWRFQAGDFRFNDRMIHILFHLNRSKESRGRLYLSLRGLDHVRLRGEQSKRFLVEYLTSKKFRMRPLEQMNAAMIEFGSYAIAKCEPTLCVPAATTFPAIDAVLVVPADRRIIYVQMAADRAHPIQYERLSELYQGLSRREEFRGYTHLLLFIVSGGIYDGFTNQPYTSTPETAEADIGVTQYVGKFIPH